MHRLGRKSSVKPVAGLSLVVTRLYEGYLIEREVVRELKRGQTRRRAKEQQARRYGYNQAG